MAQSRWAAIAWLLVTFALVFKSAEIVRAAPTVWTGPTITFMKTGADTADTTDPLNQDRLTANVWLTRGAVEGIFNIAPGHEDAYVRFTSPADTLWATSVMAANTGKVIAATNWQALTFTNWAPAYGGPGMALGANITTHNAVVHLLTDDIYLDLQFSFLANGGEFIYQRSTSAALLPMGDYNHNGTVDAADYVIWRRTVGGAASPAGSGADGNSSGTIDPGDFTFWRERFGAITSGSGARLTPIPEPRPTLLALHFIGLAVCLYRIAPLRIRRTNYNQ